MTAAEQLALWLEQTHPEVYSQLQSHALNLAHRQILNRTRLRGFGQDDGSGMDLSSVMDDTSAVDSSAMDLSSVMDSGETITVSADAISQPILTPVDTSNFSTPSDITTDIAGPTANTLPVTSSSGPSFLEQLGSGVTQAASGVANFLTSPQGLTALTNLGTAYFATTAAATNAKTQTAILQAQVAQASAGRSPYPITYAQSGSQLVPVYNMPSVGINPNGTLNSPVPIPAALANAIATGQAQYIPGVGYTIPENTVSALSGLSLSSILPWLLLIAGGLLFLSR